MVSRRIGAAGAVVAQFSQAFGSFLLQVLALRFLGVEGLGRFAMLFGVIVIATAIVSGLTGDSLTVLDRSNPRVRAGLQAWLAGVATSAALLMGGVAAAADLLPPVQALLFGLAGLAFVVEDAMRRLLMASLRFWSLVVVDTAAMVFSVGPVVVLRVVADDLTLTAFLAGMVVGQTLACAVALACLPAAERWYARGVERDLAAVWRFGSWRALQQMMRPTMLAAIRVVVSVTAGLAAFGQLEAARVYIAPAMLAVAGIASFLFASYARDASSPIGDLLRRADRTVAGLAVAASTLGVVATVLVPVLGPFLVSGDERLDRLAVLGWAAYAVATATVTPYGSLAAVRGRQAGVLAFRAAESVVSIALCVALLAAGTSELVVPLLLAGVSVASGLAMRVVLLAPAPARMAEQGDRAVGAV